jgi:hypothetical protein
MARLVNYRKEGLAVIVKRGEFNGRFDNGVIFDMQGDTLVLQPSADAHRTKPENYATNSLKYRLKLNVDRIKTFNTVTLSDLKLDLKGHLSIDLTPYLKESATPKGWVMPLNIDRAVKFVNEYMKAHPDCELYMENGSITIWHKIA